MPRALRRRYGPVRMRLSDAKNELRVIGVVLTKRDGEYRAVKRGGTEASAYYTDDLRDVVSTAKHQWGG